MLKMRAMIIRLHEKIRSRETENALKSAVVALLARLNSCSIRAYWRETAGGIPRLDGSGGMETQRM
jgi:hypothetical protein